MSDWEHRSPRQRGLLRGALYAAALLLGYGLAVTALRQVLADPLLLQASPGADEFLSNTVGSMLLLCAAALAIDVVLTETLRLQVRESRRLGIYLIFMLLSVLALYLSAPQELIWISLLGFVVPLRVGQQVWSAESRRQGQGPIARTSLLQHGLAVLATLLAAVIVFNDNKLRLPLLAWMCLFVALNYLLGRRENNRPALNLLLVFVPLVFSLPLVLALQETAGAGMVLYSALLLGIALVMQRLLASPGVRWANTLLFVLALGGLLSIEALIRAGPLNALAQARGLSASMVADNTLGWMPQNLLERLNIEDTRWRSQALTDGLEAKPARMLIVCLGGSSTEAHDLPVQARWTSQLERQLGMRGIDARVINAGVSGYASFQSLTLFRELLRQARPDLVIIYSGNNDYERSKITAIGMRQWSELSRRRELGQGTSWTVAAQRLFSRSAAYNLMVRLGIITRIRFAQANSNSPEEYYRNLDELAQEAHARGSRIVFVAEATSHPTAGYDNAMAEAASKNGAPYLNIEPLLLEHYHREELFLTYCHLNAKGSELMAAILADFLEKRGLLTTPQ